MAAARLHSLPVPTDRTLGASHIDLRGSEAVFSYDYEADDGTVRVVELKFEGLQACRWVVHEYCQLTDLHDLSHAVEFEDSPWLRELRALRHPVPWDAPELRHFSIYFDDRGCLDIIAAGLSSGLSDGA